MAITKTEICNLALSELGENRNQITDFDTDTDAVAKQCRLHFPRAFDELIRMHTWNCCGGRGQLTSTSFAGHGWEYSSELPSDCIRTTAIYANDTIVRSYSSADRWIIEGRNVLTDFESPYIEYLKEPNLDDADPLFIRALYFMLASKLAIPLKGDNGRGLRGELLSEIVNIIIPEASSVDGFESDDFEPVESEWLAATYNSNYNQYPFNQPL